MTIFTKTASTEDGPPRPLRLFLASFEGILSGFLLVLLTALLFVQIVNRYIFGISFVWIEEIARISFVWLVYFSAASAARGDRHIRIEIADLFLPPAALRAMTHVADILVIGFDLVVAWLGILLVHSTILYGDRSPVTEIPMGVIYAVIPVCFALMAFRLFHFNLRKHQDGAPPPVRGLE
jgi:TRAP-type C4-dicarboxylate transport system permease small subunit